MTTQLRSEPWEDENWPLSTRQLPIHSKIAEPDFKSEMDLPEQQQTHFPTSPGQSAESFDFLQDCAPGDATIQYRDKHGQIHSIANLNIFVIGQASALLPHAFEETRAGVSFYSELLSPITAPGFVRFLYTGTYSPPSEDGFGDVYSGVPTSLLMHCQMFLLGETYDVRNLRRQAYVNVLRQCEFACSSPSQPIDLCPAVRFVYRHLSSEELLVDAIVNYCVECLLVHKLPDDAEFRELVYDLRAFALDLNSNIRKRGFEGETAQAIIQMQSKTYAPETYASREDVPAKRMSDIVFHFHGEDEYDNPPKRRKSLGASQDKHPSNFSLPIRALEPLAEVEPHIKSETLQPKALTNEKEPEEESGASDWEVVVAPVDKVGTVSSSSEDESDATDIEFERVPLLDAASRPGVSALSNMLKNQAESGSESDWSVV